MDYGLVHLLIFDMVMPMKKISQCKCQTLIENTCFSDVLSQSFLMLNVNNEIMIIRIFVV